MNIQCYVCYVCKCTRATERVSMMIADAACSARRDRCFFGIYYTYLSLSLVARSRRLNKERIIFEMSRV